MSKKHTTLPEVNLADLENTRLDMPGGVWTGPYCPPVYPSMPPTPTVIQVPVRLQLAAILLQKKGEYTAAEALALADDLLQPAKEEPHPVITRPKEFHLLIDDVRIIPDMGLVARTPDEGKDALRAGSTYITHLWLDNDLACPDGVEGIHILAWARDNGLVPPNVCILTANPVARNRMEKVLAEDLGYCRDGNFWRKRAD